MQFGESVFCSAQAPCFSFSFLASASLIFIAGLRTTLDQSSQRGESEALRQ